MTNKLQKRALEIAFDRGASVREVLEMARESDISLTVMKSAGALTVCARTCNAGEAR
jgi:hypothetical protein